MKLRHMPLMVGDLLSDSSVMLMSNFHLGGYMRLLCHMWLEGGELPNDPRVLARLAHVLPKSWGAFWDVVGSHFGTTEDGLKLNHGKISVLLRFARSTSEARAKAAQARWNADANASANGMQPCRRIKSARPPVRVIPPSTEYVAASSEPSSVGEVIGGVGGSRRELPPEFLAWREAARRIVEPQPHDAENEPAPTGRE